MWSIANMRTVQIKPVAAHPSKLKVNFRQSTRGLLTVSTKDNPMHGCGVRRPTGRYRLTIIPKGSTKAAHN